MPLLSIGLGSAQPVFSAVGEAEGTSTPAIELQNSVTENTDYFDNGFYQEAVKYWRSVAKQHRQQNEKAAEAVALFNLASAQRAIGQDRRAIRSLEVALNIARKTDDANLQANITSSLAAAYLYAGKFEKSTRLFVEARGQAMVLKDLKLEALILNDMGNMFAFQGRYEKALEAYQSSIYLAEKTDDLTIVAKALTNSALVKVNQGEYSEAKQLVLSAIRSLESVSDSYDKAESYVKLGELSHKILLHSTLNQQAFAKQMVEVLNQSAAYAKTSANDRLTSHSLGVLGGLYEIAEQNRDALKLTEKALFYAQQVDAPDLLYQWEWQAARLQKKLGNIDDALRLYRFSVESLQPIRHELTRRNLGNATSFQETQGGVYLELADLLLQKSSTVDNKKSVSEYLLEARDTVERQKEAELQDYFKDSCVINTKAKVKLIDETIADDTAVIYPILLPDRVELLVSYSSGIERYTVNKGADEVTENVRALRVKLEKRKTREFLPYATTLYKWLIAPMDQDFAQRNISTLVVVSGQSLRTIPLSALHDGERFLINKYAIAITPGLTLTDPRPLRRGNINILLSGLSEPVQGFPALQHVQGELEEIQDIYVGKLLINREFVTSSISDALQDTSYSVTHIASHSVFTGDVNDSYILTYDNRITVNQLGEFAALSRNNDKPIELLTLSSCQTAAGDDRAALGLAGVAIKSGARSAVATLWAINDQASAALITEFYRQLQDEDVSKAQALQRAQSSLMQNVRYRHPGYWSPFLLIGNWL